MGVKCPGKADHSSPSSAEVKNEWSYTSCPPYAFRHAQDEVYLPQCIFVITIVS
jgi:hypothetical protein